MDKELYRRARRAELQRGADLSDAAAGNGIVDGRFRVNNTGEAEKYIYFPVKFSKLPLITFGYEMLSGDVVVPGQFPTVNAQLADWIVEERPPISRLYTGAKIRVVSTGPAYHKFIVHWKVSGVAFTNPV